MKLKLKISSESIELLIVGLCGFFLAIGSGINRITGFDFSKLFLASGTIMILISILKFKVDRNYFPQSYLFFILFMLLPSFITWVLLFNNDLTKPYAPGEEIPLILIFRFFFFIVFGLFIALYFDKWKFLKIFIIFCNWGFLTSLLFGIYETFFHNALISLGSYDFRVSGGFANPNMFGQYSSLVVFSNLLVYSNKQQKEGKTFVLLFIILGFVGILLSQSRAALLGISTGIVYFLITSSISNKFKIFSGLLFLTVIILVVMPDNITDRLKNRIIKPQQNSSSNERNHKEERLIIWHDYLNFLPNYVFQGYGKERERYITKEFRSTSTNFVTHNSYLNLLTNFGIIGLFLFLICYLECSFRIRKFNQERIYFKSDKVLIAWIIAWFIVLFLGDYIDSRDFWVFLAILIGYGNMKRQSRNILVEKDTY